MNSLSLVFAVYNHQPSGNFESVVEDAYRPSYLPSFPKLIGSDRSAS
jgi:hypothetical protein